MGSRHEEPLELLVENGKLMGLSFTTTFLGNILERGSKELSFFWCILQIEGIYGSFNYFAVVFIMSVPNTDHTIAMK